MTKHLTVYENCSLGGIVSVIRERFKAYQDHGIDQTLYFVKDKGGVQSLRSVGAENIYIGSKAVEVNISNIVEMHGIETVALFSYSHMCRQLKRQGLKVFLEIHDCPPATVAPFANLRGGYEQIIVPSQWSKNWVNAEAGIPMAEITVVPNMINNHCFYRDDRKPINHSAAKPMLWVGRLDERKNWRDAVLVASILKKRGLKVAPFFALTLLSEDNIVQEFFDQLALHGIDSDSRVYFNLQQSDLAAMMRDMAVQGGCFLSTARLESYGLGVVESMACGLPVVASAVGAVPEHIRHRETGFLYDFGERVVAADSVEECLFVRTSRTRVLEGLAANRYDIYRQKTTHQLLGLLGHMPRD